MGGSFDISREDLQNFGSSLISNSCSVKRDLALVKDSQSRRWKLIDLRKDEAPSEGSVIRGKKLVLLMQAVANGKTSPPLTLSDTFSDKEFHTLTHDANFQGLCRMVPGMEQPEHARSRARSLKALHRAYKAAKVIGKGLAAIERKGQIGRYVGQEHGVNPFWIREVIYRGSLKTYREIDMLTDGWMLDTTSKLSIKEWESAKRHEWEKLKTQQDFLPWLAGQTWQRKEKEAFDKDHPGQPFDETAFSKWKREQADPELALPTWFLKEKYGTTNEISFPSWRRLIVDQEKNVWERFKNKTGVTLSFKDYEQQSFEHRISGSIDSHKRWILHALWAKARTNDDFPTFVKRLKFSHDNPGSAMEEEFRQWTIAQEEALHRRHEGSHLPLPFEEWKLQQNDDILADPMPFVALGKKERHIYQTSCTLGTLLRNGHPLDTAFEATVHSGEGFAIFVIGPNEDLYCGSHILGVFHHSSFLGDMATIAAGEVKTNPDGSIAALSNKSGHYQPGNAQDVYMLRYFRDRGVDLSKVKMLLFDADRPTNLTALQYLEQLERPVSPPGSPSPSSSPLFAPADYKASLSPTIGSPKNPPPLYHILPIKK